MMDDLKAFLIIAREQSFTRAAAELRVTPSALSHSMRGLEERLGIRLLARTTRNVSPTEAGERLARSIGPLYEQIAEEIDRLGELRDRPAGTIRITGSDDAIQYILKPKLAGFLEEYPDITIEVGVDYGFTNIVNDRFDAGIRLGEAISKDMIAVRISPDWRLSVVGSPAYFEKHARPADPRELTAHNCINIRHSAASGLYAWEFEKDGEALNIKVDGQYIANSNYLIQEATLDGVGLSYLPSYMVQPLIENGQLIEVLSDWSPYFSGFYLYYPNRRQSSPAFMAFVQAVRHKD